MSGRLFLTSANSFLISTCQKAATQRTDLISTSATLLSPSDTRRRFQPTQPQYSTLHPGLRPQQSEDVSESPFRGPTPQPGFSSRERNALDEHTFIQNAENKIDEFLAQGREALGNLTDQRDILKGTQKRLLDAANTLGLSRDVIGWIERRRSAVFLLSSYVK
jgi:golgi SNAP receptor complex member 2